MMDEKPDWIDEYQALEFDAQGWARGQNGDVYYNGMICWKDSWPTLEAPAKWTTSVVNWTPKGGK